MLTFLLSFSIIESMAILSHSDLHNASGKPYSRDLFVEWNKEAILSLAKEPKNGAVSLYKLFVALTEDDPSETMFAEEVFGDVGFWLRLQESPFISSELVEWRKVVAQKRKQKAFAAIIKEVKEGGRSSFSAAKYLIEEPWKLTGTPVASRKKIAKDIAESAEKAFEDASITHDMQRLKEAGLMN